MFFSEYKLQQQHMQSKTFCKNRLVYLFEFVLFVTTTLTFHFHLRHTMISIFDHLKQHQLNSTYHLSYATVALAIFHSIFSSLYSFYFLFISFVFSSKTEYLL